MKQWYEVQFDKIGFSLTSRQEAFSSKYRWLPHKKGGEYRRWYGNCDFIIDWENDGHEIINNPSARPQNLDYMFQEGVTWSHTTVVAFSARISNLGYTFNVEGPTFFFPNPVIILSYFCSKVVTHFMELMNPTLHFLVGNVSLLPFDDKVLHLISEKVENTTSKAIYITKQDWDNFETSWDFQTHPLLRHNTKHLTEAFNIWQSKSETAFRELQRLEEENNRYWIDAYELQDELTPEVPDNQITIRRADLNKDIRSLISYAVGCIMGRYSLDNPGLIHAGQPFDPSLHQTLNASSDAIILITDQEYFDNDIVARFLEFLRVVYSPETLIENLNFIANALTLKNGESAQERIRRYFLQEFISDHIQTYKKRPIYWLFTSGKKRAFGALVYLHRYNEDTLARIRTDYVLELQVKLDGEIVRAQQQLENASSSAAKKAATNRLKDLQAQQLELRDYQAKLQTLADARINLDLDDGVAYNYTRFKGLVYEGSDLKMADLEKASQWKRELLK